MNFVSMPLARLSVLFSILSIFAACAPSVSPPQDGAVDDVASTLDASGGTDVPNACPAPLMVCNGACTRVTDDRLNCGACNNVCPGVSVCVAGGCTLVCPTGQFACGTYCANLQSDNANCGACGISCPAGQSCSMGRCGFGCAPTQMLCGGLCTNVESDNANCGACGTPCPSGQVCSSGRCQTTCGVSLTNCAGTCTSTQTDPANCGGCGVMCSVGQRCAGGVCGVACLPSQMVCGGICTNVETDNANCGACGTACPAGQVCSSGRCQASCGASLTNCAGTCTSTQTDPANCGGCGVTCAVGQRCAGGVCGVACTPSQMACNGMCANVDSDNANCGACGVACSAGQACVSGHCETSCGATLTNCGGICANTASDPANCGACGTACAAGQYCSMGRCDIACGPGTSLCGGMCANTMYDPLNCGSCGHACPSTAPNATGFCVAGTCGITCITGYADCDNNPVNGCEIDLRSDARNCGACRNQCSLANASTTTCSGGSCGVGTCYSSYGNCDGNAANGCETYVYSDPRNCQSCGTVCSLPNTATNACGYSGCAVGTCVAGYGNCDNNATNGCETDVRTSLANCGACGQACALPNATSSACAGGACVFGACNAGYGNCDANGSNGCEVNLQRSNSNCGACGTVCPSGTACSAGACVTAPACSAGTAPRVLVFGGLGTYEQPYFPTGSSITIATDAMWRSMTTTDFSAYALIVFGASYNSAALQTLYDTRAAWGPAITGRVVVDGYDAGAHTSTTGVTTYLRNTFTWLTTGLGTALYASTDGAYRRLDYLSSLGAFSSTYASYGPSRVLQPGHPIMSGLTDATISTWSWHTSLTAPSTFDVVAVYGSGTTSVPEIVARDVTCATR